MNSCNSYINPSKLVGLLNNSIIVKESGDGSQENLLFEEILYSNKWNVNENGEFIYTLSHPNLNQKFFIQVIPNLTTEEEKKAIIEANINQNIYINSNNSTISYNLYAEQKPTIDISITIFALKIKEEE